MRFNSMKYIALLVLAAATVAGCTKAPAPDLGEELNVLLQMSVGTKAVTETDGTPTDAESAIHTLRVYAFVDGQAAGHFYTDDYATLEDAADAASGAAKHFLMDIKMYSLGSRKVDFYVIANEEAMATAGSAPAGFDENTTKDELNGFTFTSLNLGNGMAFGLPMCCKKTETINFAIDDENNPQTAPDHEGHTLLAQKLSFELERPVGKIGVFAAKPIGEEGTLTVTGLSVTRSRFVNFLMCPDNLENAYGNQGSSATRELATVDDPVLSSVDSGEENAAQYTPVQAEAYYPFENPWGSGSWSLPGDARGNILTISYKYDSDSQERTGTVYLPPIVRNTYYMVCCLLSNTGKIMVNYSVADWDDSEPYELEFDAPEYTLPTQSYPVVTGPPYSDMPKVYYNGDPDAKEGTFSINFSIEGPTGQLWTPTLLNATDADYQITVTQNGSPVAAPYLASADPYEITIRALRPDNVGKMPEFAISYTPQWDPTGTSLLMINGDSEDDLTWPVPAGTLNPTYKIVIEQVEP